MMTTDAVFALLTTYGPWVVFAAAFLSCLALPIPTSLMMLAGGAVLGALYPLGPDRRGRLGHTLRGSRIWVCQSG